MDELRKCITNFMEKGEVWHENILTNKSTSESIINSRKETNLKEVMGISQCTIQC